eukprot:1188267-Prorocentrum_minimum.AAC.2
METSIFHKQTEGYDARATELKLFLKGKTFNNSMAAVILSVAFTSGARSMDPSGDFLTHIKWIEWTQVGDQSVASRQHPCYAMKGIPPGLPLSDVAPARAGGLPGSDQKCGWLVATYAILRIHFALLTHIQRKTGGRVEFSGDFSRSCEGPNAPLFKPCVLGEGRQPWRYFVGQSWKWNNFDFVVLVACLIPGLSTIARIVRVCSLVKLVKAVDTLNIVIQGPRGEKRERVGMLTRGQKRGRASGLLRAPSPLLAQENP